MDAKDNQPNLEGEISGYVQDDMLRKKMDCEARTEKSRDRIETRTAYSTDDVAWLYGKDKWKNLIGAIQTEFEKGGRKTQEWHYYISSRKLMAVELLHHARMEWAVETMHWLLDVHYGIDFRVDFKKVLYKTGKYAIIVKRPEMSRGLKDFSS